MSWLIKTFQTSIGKKLMMAVTGLSFCAFLVVHFVGNFYLYIGREGFNSYVEHLHGLGPLIILTEIGLLAFLIIHVLTGVNLFFDNLAARQSRYLVKTGAGGETWPSKLMPYTGLYILAFVLIHLVTFKFGAAAEPTVYDLVDKAFSTTSYIIFYMFTMVVVAFHISHGVWSAFQTLGANHPKYMPNIMKLGLAFAVAVGVGFGLIPIYVALT